ncbi:MAG: SurA N-terminal domain-containing protein [Dehalococcoidia bacterium]|nr:SurA N-terminal domain-containing protein [Dehalococcoidia bacterium]
MKPRKWIVAVTLTLGLAGLAAGAASYVLAQGGGGGSDSARLARVLNAPNPFPEVVATVNGQPISGTALARRVEILRMNYEDGLLTGRPGEGQLVADALDALIRNELLVQAAKERGVWPTQEEVIAQARRLKEAVLQLPIGSPEREAALRLWEEQGVTVDEIDSDPTVLEGLARELATGRVTSDLGRPPPGSPTDIDAHRAAVSGFVDTLRAEAKIDVYVATATE